MVKVNREDVVMGAIIGGVFLVGLTMLGIGLSMVAPWIAFVAIGSIAIIAGFMMLREI